MKMKLKTTIQKGIRVLLATAVVSVSIIGSASAGGINTEVIDEKWGKPTFIHGGGLNEAQVAETAKLLGITKMENVKVGSASGEDLKRYVGGESDTGSMISSVLVKKENKGKGVSVKIETPKNITEITQSQYANAAITAGVSDASIVVASVLPVTGESALTGVYKAFALNGVELDTARTEVAQEELETVNTIVQENKSNEKFDPTKLDSVIIEVKQKLTELVDGQKELATKEDIERIITEALANQNLQNIVSQDNVQQLILLFQNYQNTGAINSTEAKAQLSELAGTVGQKAQEIYKQAEQSGLLDKIIAFFTNIFESFTKIFQ